MNKKIYIAPEFEYVDMYLENIIMVSGGDNNPGSGTITDPGYVEAKEWGGEWFDDQYAE